MTAFAHLLDRVVADRRLAIDDAHQPLGVAWLAGEGKGIDLAAHGYLEQEFLLSGDADVWTWDDRLRPVIGSTRPFTTRVLVRRPADPARFSGSVQLEPLHPDDDQPLSWGMLAPWIVAEGHAHVGVTQEPRVVPELIAYDAERYGRLEISDAGQRWDIVALAAALTRTGGLPALADLDVERVVMSGWSNTGSFCRGFLGEGMHARAHLDGRPVIDGYVICISSGGFLSGGYPSLRADRRLPLDDPRRTIGAHGVPVIELLSEGESETHQPVLRPDADGPDDLYRLYQVAGTGHITTGVRSLLTSRRQKAGRGLPSPPREINESPSDARMDMVARAVFAALDRWIATGTAPPTVPRFTYADPASSAPRGLAPGAVPLARDGDGNVVGGIRTPWVEVPRATYLPHSTPRDGRCEPGPNAPYRDPARMADLISHARPLPGADLRRRYGSPDAYLERFAQVAHEAADRGWLRPADLPELITATRRSSDGW